MDIKKRGLMLSFIWIMVGVLIIVVLTMILITGAYESSVKKIDSFCKDKDDGRYNVTFINAAGKFTHIICINKSWVNDITDGSDTCHSAGCLIDDAKMLGEKLR